MCTWLRFFRSSLILVYHITDKIVQKLASYLSFFADFCQLQSDIKERLRITSEPFIAGFYAHSILELKGGFEPPTC